MQNRLLNGETAIHIYGRDKVVNDIHDIYSKAFKRSKIDNPYLKRSIENDWLPTGKEGLYLAYSGHDMIAFMFYQQNDVNMGDYEYEGKINTPGYIEVSMLASIEKGCGKHLMAKAKCVADAKGLDLVAMPYKNDLIGYYESLGMQKVVCGEPQLPDVLMVNYYS